MSLKGQLLGYVPRRHITRFVNDTTCGHVYAVSQDAASLWRLTVSLLSLSACVYPSLLLPPCMTLPALVRAILQQLSCVIKTLHEQLNMRMLLFVLTKSPVCPSVHLSTGRPARVTHESVTWL
jgi:hypothetical protein